MYSAGGVCLYSTVGVGRDEEEYVGGLLNGNGKGGVVDV